MELILGINIDDLIYYNSIIISKVKYTVHCKNTKFVLQSIPDHLCEHFTGCPVACWPPALNPSLQLATLSRTLAWWPHLS